MTPKYTHRGRPVKVTASVLKEVKGMLNRHPQQYIASKTSLSQYTIFCIANGHYEVRESRQEAREKGMFDWREYKGGMI